VIKPKKSSKKSFAVLRLCVLYDYI